MTWKKEGGGRSGGKEGEVVKTGARKRTYTLEIWGRCGVLIIILGS